MSTPSAIHRSTARRWEYLPAFAQEQLPRYTSYPPANRFSGAVGPSAARAALTTLPGDATLSLYIHIPFCKKLCFRFSPLFLEHFNPPAMIPQSPGADPAT